MLHFLTFLFLFNYFEYSDNLVAYDRTNLFLNIPHNEIHSITNEIDNYKPKLRVKFINFQNVKRRKATQIQNGRIKIETRPPSTIEKTVEKVKFEEDFVELRFGGASKAHFPYNRVLNYRERNTEIQETETEAPTTSTPLLPSVIPDKWATLSTTTPNYSAEPALYLPSRFTKRKENVVIVYKKKAKIH